MKANPQVLFGLGIIILVIPFIFKLVQALWVAFSSVDKVIAVFVILFVLATIWDKVRTWF